MVARTPPKKPMKKIGAPLDPNQLRETLNKVEKCMARLQELQYITGGTKMVSGVNLSPRSTRGYLRTSLRCKQESLRIRNGNGQRSPPGKLPNLPTQIGEWKRMSLPAMLLGETVGEILQASQFAREIVTSVETKAKKTTTTVPGDPKTPVTESRRNSRTNGETTELRARRNREKHIIRSDQNSPLLQRAKSRINFKVSGSPTKKEKEPENIRFSANKVSPKNRPWARKTVIFPNPLFHTSSTSQPQRFCRTKSPVIARKGATTPHKFLIKTPPPAPGKLAATSAVKFQVKKAVSPPKKVSTGAKLRMSFSPSRLASRLVSPLKSRKSSCTKRSVEGCGSEMMMNMMSGLKQRPVSSTTPMMHL